MSKFSTRLDSDYDLHTIPVFHTSLILHFSDNFDLHTIPVFRTILILRFSDKCIHILANIFTENICPKILAIEN